MGQLKTIRSRKIGRAVTQTARYVGRSFDRRRASANDIARRRAGYSFPRFAS